MTAPIAHTNYLTTQEQLRHLRDLSLTTPLDELRHLVLAHLNKMLEDKHHPGDMFVLRGDAGKATPAFANGVTPVELMWFVSREQPASDKLLRLKSMATGEIERVSLDEGILERITPDVFEFTPMRVSALHGPALKWAASMSALGFKGIDASTIDDPETLDHLALELGIDAQLIGQVWHASAKDPGNRYGSIRQVGGSRATAIQRCVVAAIMGETAYLPKEIMAELPALAWDDQEATPASGTYRELMGS